MGEVEVEHRIARGVGWHGARRLGEVAAPVKVLSSRDATTATLFYLCRFYSLLNMLQLSEHLQKMYLHIYITGLFGVVCDKILSLDIDELLV